MAKPGQREKGKDQVQGTRLSHAMVLFYNTWVLSLILSPPCTRQAFIFKLVFLDFLPVPIANCQLLFYLLLDPSALILVLLDSRLLIPDTWVSAMRYALCD
jgi:hypothetical protein